MKRINVLWLAIGIITLCTLCITSVGWTQPGKNIQHVETGGYFDKA